VEEVRKYWTVRVFLQATYKKTLRDNWPLPTNVLRDLWLVCLPPHNK